MATLPSKNVQAIIPGEAHEILRSIAYRKGIPLKDFIAEILLEKVQKLTSTDS